MSKSAQPRLTLGLCGLLTSLLLGAACGGSWSNEDLRFRASIPARQQLQSKLTQAAGSAAGQALTKGLSPLFVVTRDESQAYNDGLFGILDMLEAVTTQAPSTRKPNLRVWGPMRHPNSAKYELRVVVRRVDPAADTDPSNDGDPIRFEHALQLRKTGSGEAGWVSFVAGAFERRGSLRHGVGGLILDVDALRKQGLPTGGLSKFASIQMVYDSSGWPLKVGVVVLPADPSKGQLRYGYLEGEDGGGTLRFVLTQDIVGGAGSALETLVVAGQWMSKGPGRATALIRGGDLSTPAYKEECWEASGQLVFSRDFLGQEEGARLDCPPIAPPEPVDP